MPSIYKEREKVYEYEDVDISVEEFFYECSDDEITKLIKLLIGEGYIDEKQDVFTLEDKRDCITFEFDKMVDHLSSLRLRISLEDEEIIREILNKY